MWWLWLWLNVMCLIVDLTAGGTYMWLGLCNVISLVILAIVGEENW